MKLNHVDLPVANIAAVRLFFETHFETRCIFTRSVRSVSGYILILKISDNQDNGTRIMLKSTGWSKREAR
jgi:hypothetical protein